MASILLTIHIIVAVSLVISVLLQRSEGGLGGLGGGMSNIMSSQSSNNFITKLTLYLATGFIVTSLSLAIISSNSNKDSIIESDIINNFKEKDVPTVPLAE
jgi:preprotein translocase subunit SecG|tara:strand:- start:257 stop:559 length:303 start_codon:yes stop_codon:yes gene_type:complete